MKIYLTGFTGLLGFIFILCFHLPAIESRSGESGGEGIEKINRLRQGKALFIIENILLC
jgi:hypothetical protein